jgi:hypothetical protein
MTQDQRNAFLKLVEQVKGEYRSRSGEDYEEKRAKEAEAEKKLEAKYGLGALRKRLEKAEEAKRLAYEKVEATRTKIHRELNIVELKKGREFERTLEAFTRAVAEVLAADDAKEPRKNNLAFWCHQLGRIV